MALGTRSPPLNFESEVSGKLITREKHIHGDEHLGRAYSPHIVITER